MSVPTADCYHVSNRIHNEVETANAYGYSAPIWAGVQGMHIGMGRLFELGVPTSLDVKFSFLRPVFWTDTVELWAPDDDGPQAGTGLGTYQLTLPGQKNKVAMSMDVGSLTYAPV